MLMIGAIFDSKRDGVYKKKKHTSTSKTSFGVKYADVLYTYNYLQVYNNIISFSETIGHRLDRNKSLSRLGLYNMYMILYQNSIITTINLFGGGAGWIGIREKWRI